MSNIKKGTLGKRHEGAKLSWKRREKRNIWRAAGKKKYTTEGLKVSGVGQRKKEGRRWTRKQRPAELQKKVLSEEKKKKEGGGKEEKPPNDGRGDPSKALDAGRKTGGAREKRTNASRGKKGQRGEQRGRTKKGAGVPLRNKQGVGERKREKERTGKRGKKSGKGWGWPRK